MDDEEYEDGSEDHGSPPIIVEPTPDLPADRRTAARWVQYEAPVFVRVEPDEDGWGTEITKVIVVVEPEDLHLARDDRGHFLVYDHEFNLLKGARREDPLDGLRSPVSVAEDKHRWPEEHVIAACDGWEVGPDPRNDPYYYEEPDEDEDDDEEEDDGYALVDVD